MYGVNENNPIHIIKLTVECKLLLYIYEVEDIYMGLIWDI